MPKLWDPSLPEHCKAVGFSPKSGSYEKNSALPICKMTLKSCIKKQNVENLNKQWKDLSLICRSFFNCFFSFLLDFFIFLDFCS